MRKSIFGMIIIGLTVVGMLGIAHGFDAKYKYIIPTMKTDADAAKVKTFIETLPGIYEIDIYLDKGEVVIFFDDEELDDEKMMLRIPLKKEIGYPVARYDILYEDPNKRN